MDRRIGSIFLMLWLVCRIDAVADQYLQVGLADLQGNAINQAEIGVPFLMQVVSHNIESSDQPQGFDAWDNFAATLYGQSHATSSVNGKMSKQTTFTYVVTAQQKGSFDLAPLSMVGRQGMLIKSERIKIVIGDATQIQQNRSMQPYVLQVDLGTKVFYVGQKISAKLRFCYKDPFDELRISESAMEHIHRGYVSQLGDPGTAQIGGVEYQTQDFLMELYPEKTGTLVIPSFQAAFTPAARYQHNIAQMFALMMGSGHVIQSQPRSIDVRPLPASKEFSDVTAIGNFDTIKFSISSSTGNVGEGLLAKMVIEGDGNLEVVKAPKLLMPEGIHYYEGNNSVQRLENGRFRKEFEWIVQSERAGDFTIAEQIFSYFDPVKQSYKVLKSAGAQLKIVGGAPLQPVDEPTVTPTAQSTTNETIKPEPLVVEQPIVQQGWSYLTQFQTTIASTMLTWLIELLIGLILLFISLLLARDYVRNLFFIQTLRFRFKFFACCRKKDMQGLYRLLETLLQKYGLEMHSPELEVNLAALGLPEEAFENWKNFANMILELNFAKNRNSDEAELAFSLAKQWFPIILSCCKMHKKQTQNQTVS